MYIASQYYQINNFLDSFSLLFDVFSLVVPKSLAEFFFCNPHLALTQELHYCFSSFRALPLTKYRSNLKALDSSNFYILVVFKEDCSFFRWVKH